ncbi:MAG: carbohydrate ABC transporter permease [Fusobacteriaceae bacterium]
MHKEKINKLTLYVTLGIIAIICILPFYMVMINATRSSQEIISGFSFTPGKSLMQNWRQIGVYFDLIRGMKNSLFLSVSITFLVSYFSALTAYGFTVYEFKGKNIILGSILGLMMVPSQLGLIGFYELIINMGLLDSYIPLIVPAIASPFAVFFLRQYLISVLPMAIIEAARIDGAGEIQIFHKIAIPIMLPGIATNAIFTFIGSWNSYLLPLIILLSPEKFTLPLLMGYLKGAVDITLNMGASYLAIATSILPIMLAFIFFSKYIISSVSAGAVKE